MASSELAPRLQLVAFIRALLVFFGVSALLNGHAYINDFYKFRAVEAAFAVAWTLVAWNVVCVLAVAVHPHLQRLAGTLPFPVRIDVRGHAILAYGDPDSSGDGLFAPLTAKLGLALIDTTLATVILVFMLQAREKTIDCPSCVFRDLHIPAWLLNVWLTMVIFGYALAFFQTCEALSIWYKQRYLNKRGRISLA